jgi:hypothetical protein
VEGKVVIMQTVKSYDDSGYSATQS